MDLYKKSVDADQRLEPVLLRCKQGMTSSCILQFSKLARIFSIDPWTTPKLSSLAANFAKNDNVWAAHTTRVES